LPRVHYIWNQDIKPKGKYTVNDWQTEGQGGKAIIVLMTPMPIIDKKMSEYAIAHPPPQMAPMRLQRILYMYAY